MKTKKKVTALLLGAALALSPLAAAGTTGYETAYAAKGGARMSMPAPKAAPAAPKMNQAPQAEHKSVSGNGGAYAPSKSAQDLPKNAPAAKSGMMNGNMQSGSRFGNMMRNVGLFAGGMFLGSMLSHLFGFGMGGMMADVFGLIANLLMLAVLFFAVRWLFQRLRGGRRDDGGNTWQAPSGQRQTYDVRAEEPHQARPAAPRGENGASARDIADRYRSR